MPDCRKILEKIKPAVRAFIFDVDGTIKSSSEPDCQPLELINKILRHRWEVGLVTASGVTAIEGLAEPIVKLIAENNYLVPVYFGVANGVALYRLDSQGCHGLYYYSLEMDEIGHILQAWKTVISKNEIKETDLVEKGLDTFREFLKRDWRGNIPTDYLSLAETFAGQCFLEQLKATFVMPRNDILPQEKFVTMMQEQIDKVAGPSKYVIDMGDTTFAHATQRPGMTPKLFALKRIISELKLKKDQVLAFGDMPLGNDRGLLIESDLPYTFTNRDFPKTEINKPPFILPGSAAAPVASVYRAVEFLLG